MHPKQCKVDKLEIPPNRGHCHSFNISPNVTVVSTPFHLNQTLPPYKQTGLREREPAGPQIYQAWSSVPVSPLPAHEIRSVKAKRNFLKMFFRKLNDKLLKINVS